MVHITKGKFDSFPVLLPSLNEQRRIVAQLEELLSKLEAGLAALEAARQQLKQYRQAVLRAAVEGELSHEWRESQENLEPASALLTRILTERRERWETEQLEKMRAKGLEPLTDAWKAKYEKPEGPDPSSLPELPEGWVWTSLGQAFGVYIGATPSRARPDFWNGYIPWVSSGEVAFCRIYETREAITDFGLANSSTNLHPPGTVLLGMIGEGKTRGQAAILEITACNNQNCAAIRVSEAGVPPEYVYFFLESQYERTRGRGAGGNQPALNKASVQAIPMPLPPFEEQRYIISELERRLSVADAVEATLEMEFERANRLRQGILERAFAGRLVPQDPNDEPASELLHRLQLERAERWAEGQKRRAGRKMKNGVQDSVPESEPRKRGRPRKNKSGQEELF